MRYVVATLFLCLLLQSPAEARRGHHYGAYHFKHHRFQHDGFSRHRTTVRRGRQIQFAATFQGDHDGRWAAAADHRLPNSHRDRRRIRTASLGDGGAHHHGRGGRPRAWCGWYARQLVGSDPGVSYNLARNWARWGRAASPGVGVMVVWSHHVGMITGQTADGKWIVKSGNDGRAVRERPRSIAGAIAFRQG